MGADATVYESLDPAITSSFVGYDKLEAVSRISALTTEDEVVEALTDGDKGTIIVDATPFYGTMGGQEGDKGVITSADGKFAVEDTIHLKRRQNRSCGLCGKRHVQAGRRSNAVC